MKSKANNRRQVIITGALLIAALAGLFLINPGSGEADALTALENTQAVEPSPDATAAAGEPFEGTAMPSIVKMISALMVVLVCIYVALYLLKRLAGRRAGANGGNGALEVLETSYVAPKKTVSLVRVADKAVLIGVTDNGISMLTELDAQQTEALLAEKSATPSSDSFRKILGSATEKIRKVSLVKSRAALDG